MLYSSFIVCLAYLWKYNHDTKNMLKSPPLPYCNPDFLIDFRLLFWILDCSLEHDFHLKRVPITPNGSKPRKTARISRRNGLYKSVWRIPYVRVRANLIYIRRSFFPSEHCFFDVPPCEINSILGSVRHGYDVFSLLYWGHFSNDPKHFLRISRQNCRFVRQTNCFRSASPCPRFLLARTE